MANSPHHNLIGQLLRYYTHLITFRCVNAWINAYTSTNHTQSLFAAVMLVFDGTFRSCLNSAEYLIVAFCLHCSLIIFFIFHSVRSRRLLLLLCGRNILLHATILLTVAVTVPYKPYYHFPTFNFPLFLFFMRPVCIYTCTSTCVAASCLWHDDPACLALRHHLFEFSIG